MSFIDSLELSWDLMSFSELYNRGVKMVVIRLSHRGARHAPKYRITVADQRRSRDGKFIEVLGTYNPHFRENEKKLNLNLERVNHWISCGAQPTQRVKSLIREASSSGK